MASRDDDRDASLDRLIRQALATTRSGPDSSTACLDADLLAEWADGTLGPNERGAVEAHLADCARCQSLVAAFARAVPSSEPAASQRWWRASYVRWLVPLTAAAAAVVVWFVVPGSVRVQRDTLAPSAIDTVGTPGADNQVARLKEEGDASSNANRSMTATRRARERAQAPDSAAEEQRAAEDSNQPAAPQRRADAQSRSSVEGSSAADAGAPLKETIDSVARTENAAPAPAAPPLAAAKMLRADGVSAGVVIVSSNPGSRWRILGPGTVQRSMDGGGTWQTQQTGVTVTMLAGASPSPSVCWLVGPAGTVLLSSDGVTWRRIAFPEAVDLRGVAAADETSATVTAVDGRTFATTNGGRTWTATP